MRLLGLLLFLAATAHGQMIPYPGAVGSHAAPVGGWTYLQSNYGNEGAGGWEVQANACGSSFQVTCSVTTFPSTAGSTIFISRIMGITSVAHITQAFSCVSSLPCTGASGDLVDTFSLCSSGTGTVNTSGTAVTYVSGNNFNTTWTGQVTINGSIFSINSIASGTSMTLATSAGTQSGVAYTFRSCYLINSGQDNDDGAYVINSGGGAGVITSTVSAVPNTFDDFTTKEIMPPTCSGVPCPTVLDNNGNGSTAFTTSGAGCSPCTGPIFTITGQDGVIEAIDTNAVVQSPSGPFVLDFIGDVMGFDLTTGTAVTFNTTLQFSLTGIAVKTIAAYTPPPAPWSELAPGQPTNHLTGGFSCSPTCPAITLPVTVSSANTLIFIHAQVVPGNVQTTIASITDNKGNTYTVPTAANTCKNTSSTIDLSCGWSIIGTGGVTSVTPTMNASTTAYFGIYLVNTSSGVPVLDVQGSSNSSSSSSTVTGQTLSLSGPTEHVCFAEMGWPGTGSNNVEIGAYLYPSPQGANFFGGYGANSANGTTMMLLNARTGAAPKVRLNNSVASQASSGVCFKHT